jgi:hypothetical protein
MFGGCIAAIPFRTEPDEECRMSSLRLIIAALAVTVCAGTALAQGTPQQRAACRGDAARFCKGIQDTGAIHGCLQSNYSRISERCRKVLNGA